MKTIKRQLQQQPNVQESQFVYTKCIIRMSNNYSVSSSISTGSTFPPSPMKRHPAAVPSWWHDDNCTNNNHCNLLIKKVPPLLLLQILLVLVVITELHPIPTATAFMFHTVHTAARRREEAGLVVAATTGSSNGNEEIMRRGKRRQQQKQDQEQLQQQQQKQDQEQLQQQQYYTSISTRRDTLSAMVAIASGIATPYFVIYPPKPSVAATPMTAKEAESLSFRIERKLRIPPVKLLRPMLNLDFAVLLMRSSYNAVDELNFVPMDQFQRDFFLIRQAEYLPYTDSLGPGLVKQGDLTDPYYFDFISFAQYRTIYRDMSVDPLKIFEEKQPVEQTVELKNGGEGNNVASTTTTTTTQEFVTKIIQRDASIENSMLPQLYDEIVGSKILDKLIATFGDTPSAIPPLLNGGNDDNPNNRTTTTQVLKSLQQLVNLFLVNGFAFDGKVELKKDGVDGKKGRVYGSQYVVTLTAPANLWSGKSLQQLWKKNNKGNSPPPPPNDFLHKTAKVLLHRAGFEEVISSVKYTTSEEITTIELK